MTIDFQKVAEAVKKSSPDIKDLMFSLELGDKLEEIAESNELTEDEYLKMVDEVGYVILGLKNKTSFLESLNQIGINKNRTTSIEKEVNSKVFSEIGKTKNTDDSKQIPINEKTPQQPVREMGIFEKKQTIIRWAEKMSLKNSTITDKIEKLDIAKKTKSAIEINDRNNAPEYIKKLSQSIQDLIFDKAWVDRTKEIAKKYSLDPTQTDTLVNNVLFVLIGLDRPEDFLKLMTSELGISKLLADQIIEDLEMRVFEYALKTVENKEKKNPPVEIPKVTEPVVPEVKVESKPVQPVMEKPKVPEIKPQSLPMVEKGEVAHDVPHPQPKPTPEPVAPTPTPTYKPTFTENKPKVDAPKERSHITYTEKDIFPEKSAPKNTFDTKAEEVQRPVAVPRFTAEKIEETPKETVPATLKMPEPLFKKPTPIFSSEKPQTIPEKPTTPVEPPKPSTETPPVHKYTVDPYREPME